MAKMIPSSMSEEQIKKSKAEARIFCWLRNMSWGNGTVLYSLPLKDHINKSYGEIDFIVICEKGILCIEVKGGGIERKNGRWGFTNGEHVTTWKNEGPYSQVQGNMKSLKKFLEDHLQPDDDILKCRVACCVMTPDCVIKTDVADTEIIPEITFNVNMSERDMPAIFERSFNYWENKHYGGHENLSAKDRDRLATFLRGDFSFVPPLSVMLDRSEEQLISTTSEQLEILEHMMINDRMMVEGGAGTGKTLLATEQCRKSFIAGEKVLYLCYNNTIASYVYEVMQSDPCCDEISVYTFHELLIDLCNVADCPNKDDTFFNDELPNMFLDMCSNQSFKESIQFDRIVIDEGQDLMNMTAYLCINELLRGGWENGKWTIYYDASQNIFGTNEEFEETWSILKKNAFVYPLTVNCRNTKQIAQGNYAVTHVYKAVFMRAEGEDIVYKTYKDKKSEAKQVFEEIRRLRAEGIRKRDIVILSYYRIDNPKSCLYEVEIPSDIGPIQFEPYGSFNSNKNLRYYTIKSFKGMESKAVIMIDVDSFTDESKRLQNYVGMSRARTYLEFFYDEKLYQERQKRLLESLI